MKQHAREAIEKGQGRVGALAGRSKETVPGQARKGLGGCDAGRDRTGENFGLWRTNG